MFVPSPPPYWKTLGSADELTALLASAVHLGHELHQAGTMEHDAKVRRAIFIQNSTDIREMFEFAHTAQVLQAVNVYASHFYGSMLWNLYGPGAA